jgi:hypothetical protein
MRNEFTSDDDLLSFEGWMQYQAVDPAKLTPDELTMWSGYFDEATQRSKKSPKLGLMRLQKVPAEQARSNGTRIFVA